LPSQGIRVGTASFYELFLQDTLALKMDKSEIYRRRLVHPDLGQDFRADNSVTRHCRQCGTIAAIPIDLSFIVKIKIKKQT
jgi:hypothetical protein